MSKTTSEKVSEAALLKQAEFFISSNKLSQAKNICSRLLTSNVYAANALDLLAKICRQENNLDGVIKYWQQAINIAPFTKSHYLDLANVLLLVKNYQGAIDVYSHGLKFLPHDGQLNNNLGCIYHDLKQSEKALDYICQAVMIEPFNEDFIKNFLNVSMEVNAVNLKENIVKTLLNVLQDDRLDRQNLIILALQNINMDKNISWIINYFDTEENYIESFENPEFKDNLFLTMVNPVFLVMLKTLTLMRDFKVERGLTKLREVLLNALATDKVSKMNVLEKKALAEFSVALAQQNILNGYLFKTNFKETQQLSYLKQEILSSDLSGSLSYDEIILISTYFSYLKAYKDEKVLNKCEEIISQQIPGFDLLITRQVKEPIEENEIKKGITSLTEIDKDTVHVRAQYEEDPYPRWQKLEHAKGYSSVPLILQHFFPERVSELKPNFNINRILIAGSGTGKHPICVAVGNPQSQVTAVDISLSSLAYGIRKAKEINIKNLTCHHADILNLPETNLEFDVIESVGVLHHFVEPIKGWRALLKVLRPKGVMRIGLYSHIGRLDIKPIRDYIKENNIEYSFENLHKLRDKVINEDGFEKLRTRSDFFHSATCRDLIFHSQETVYKFETIRSMIEELHLEFIGFETHEAIRQEYKKAYPNDNVDNIDHWIEFEQKNPETFLNMYNFWVMKK